MDPVSIVVLVNASLGIARSLVHTVKELYELAEAYETAALGIRTVATQCNSFRVAVDRINKWLLRQTDATRTGLGEEWWEALQTNLDTANMVIEDLDRRISGLKKANPNKWWTRTKYLWNQVIIAELQTQIQGLISAVSILIQVIDIPTTGGKRTLTRAQSTRLNGLSRTARSRVEAQRKRALEAQEQDLLDDTEPLPGTTIPATVDSHPESPPTSDLANPPPPYEPSTAAVVSPPLDETKKSVRSPDYESLPEVESRQTSFFSRSKPKVPKEPKESKESKAPKEAKSPPPDSKAKRLTFMNFRKRSNKQDQSATDVTETTVEVNTSPNASQTILLGAGDSPTQIQATPAAIENSNEEPDYFGLQSALSGMGVSDTVPPGADSPTIVKSPTPTQERPSEPEQAPASPPEEQKFQSNNPYLEMRLASGSTDTTKQATKPDYSNGRKDSTNNFSRIRPSQIVKEARERSTSQGPTPRSNTTSSDASISLQRSHSGDRLSRTTSNPEKPEQSWKTTTINNRTLKFKVTFEKDRFTNKMSAAAARALGVDDNITEFAGEPVANVTLLHTLSDGISKDPTVVIGDEVEFVVMNEFESRIPQLILGAGFAHFANIMEEGEYIYWNPRAVPESLKTVDRLRLYRRFELVRW